MLESFVVDRTGCLDPHMQVHPPSSFVGLGAIFLSLYGKDFNLGLGGKIMQL